MDWIRLHGEDPGQCYECGEVSGEDGKAGAYFGMYRLNANGNRYLDSTTEEASAYVVIKKLEAPMPIHAREAGRN